MNVSENWGKAEAEFATILSEKENWDYYCNCKRNVIIKRRNLIKFCLDILVWMTGWFE